jgi:hypothetical protein
MNSINYIIKPDDTLQRIAALYYADWTLWKWIADVNPEISPTALTPGSVLLLPYPITEDTIHTIQENDSYESVSKLYYGIEGFSEKIKSENLDLKLSENIGKEILISALVSKKVLSA